MMNEKRTLPLTALTCGAATLAVRLWNLAAGFEGSSRLPIAGHPSFTLLLVLLAAAFALLLWESTRLPSNAAPRFPFRTERRGPCLLSLAGAGLLALSGAADVFESFAGQRLFDLLRGSPSWRYQYDYTGLISGEGVGMEGGVQCVSGLLTLLSAWAALECVKACRGGGLRFRTLVLIPALTLSFRLVVIYRIDSVNPVLQDYALGLAALICQILGFYTFSAFTFECGSPRRFALSTTCAAVLALCVLCDGGEYLSAPLLLLGSAAVLMGFLLLELDAPHIPYEQEP